MKDELLFMLTSICSYLSTCDLDNDDVLRNLYGQICDIQCLILNHAIKIGFKKVDIFAEIQKELGIRKED